MTNQKTTDDSRILNEMLEMAHALQGHALITKQDMAKMNLLCQSRHRLMEKRPGSHCDLAHLIAGAQFKPGVILYDGTETLPLGNCIWTAPISSLWGQ